jgi:hypothetical protein
VDHIWAAADGHAAAVSGDGGWARANEGAGFFRVGKMSSVGTFSPKVRLSLFIFLRFASASFFWWKKALEVGVVGLMGKSSIAGAKGERKRAELGFPDTMVIRGDHDRVEVKNEGRGTVGVLGAARHRYRAGGR